MSLVDVLKARATEAHERGDCDALYGIAMAALSDFDDVVAEYDRLGERVAS